MDTFNILLTMRYGALNSKLKTWMLKRNPIRGVFNIEGIISKLWNAYSWPWVCLQRLAFIVHIPHQDQRDSWATFAFNCLIWLQQGIPIMLTVFVRANGRLVMLPLGGLLLLWGIKHLTLSNEGCLFYLLTDRFPFPIISLSFFLCF